MLERTYIHITDPECLIPGMLYELNLKMVKFAVKNTTWAYLKAIV